MSLSNEERQVIVGPSARQLIDDIGRMIQA